MSPLYLFDVVSLPYSRLMKVIKIDVFTLLWSSHAEIGSDGSQAACVSVELGYYDLSVRIICASLSLLLRVILVGWQATCLPE